MKIRVLAASSSILRQSWYREELERVGCEVQTAASATACLERATQFEPDILILESFLAWGGADGVLAVREVDESLNRIPVIVIDAQRDAAQTYRISAYQLAGYWKSHPTANELKIAIETTVGRERRAREHGMAHAAAK